MAVAQRYRRWRRTAKRNAGAPIAQSESPADAPPLSALDFAQSVFRDPAQPMTLRAAMARAALPYTQARAQPREQGKDDARESKPKDVPWPFNMPDPYGAIRHDWRAVLEKAGLIPTEEQRRAAMMARAAHPVLARPPSPDDENDEAWRGQSPGAMNAATPAAPVPVSASEPARAIAPSLDPSCAPSFATAPRPHEIWPDAPVAPRRKPLPDRANRSLREAEDWR